MKYKSWLNDSAYSGRLPNGCLHCSRGGKLVLLATGKCYAGCYYCPLSKRKKGKAVVFADEKKASNDDDILVEAELINATGTGITGGDPLIDAEKTSKYISMLKDHFGDRHHIHLYTACSDGQSISAVAKAGLDEIRFHPPIRLWGALKDSPYVSAIRLSNDLGLDTGIEIPSIPGEKERMGALIRAAVALDVNFANLNELEFSPTNWKALRRRGFDVKDDVSNAVKGSQRLAIAIIRDSSDDISLHYCSSSFKDGIQLRRRIMRRGCNIRRPLDVLTRDGTLVMGIIESRKPKEMAERISQRFGIPKRLIEGNAEMGRVEIAAWVLKDIAAELNLDSYIIEEYPTADRLEVEREPIGSRRR